MVGTALDGVAEMGRDGVDGEGADDEAIRGRAVGLGGREGDLNELVHVDEQLVQIL